MESGERVFPSFGGREWLCAVRNEDGNLEAYGAQRKNPANAQTHGGRRSEQRN